MNVHSQIASILSQGVYVSHNFEDHSYPVTEHDRGREKSLKKKKGEFENDF